MVMFDMVWGEVSVACLDYLKGSWPPRCASWVCTAGSAGGDSAAGRVCRCVAHHSSAIDLSDAPLQSALQAAPVAIFQPAACVGARMDAHHSSATDPSHAPLAPALQAAPAAAQLDLSSLAALASALGVPVVGSPGEPCKHHTASVQSSILSFRSCVVMPTCRVMLGCLLHADSAQCKCKKV